MFKTRAIFFRFMGKNTFKKVNFVCGCKTNGIFMKSVINHRNIYFFGLILLAASLPLSVFTTSVAEIILLVNWLVEGRFDIKWQVLRQRRSLWFIAALYMLHLAGFLYTTDYAYGLHDLKIKLPVLLLPLVLGTSEPVTRPQLKAILLFFCSATAVSSIISFLVFIHVIPLEYYDIRDISIFVSHIRLALMVNLALFVLLYYLFSRSETERLKGRYRFIAYAAILWLAFFLFILKSITGLVVFLVISMILAWFFAGRIKEIAPRFIIRVFVLVIPLLVASWITSSVSRFYNRDKVDFSSLDSLTAAGNPYFNDTLSQATENGHYVWLYVNKAELRSCWNQRSTYKFGGKDKRGQELRYTLIRYLTSKGLRKDCVGVNALTEEDIHAIEDGKANYLFNERYSLYPRLYRIIWEIDGYMRGGNPSNHSIAQRFAYLRAAGGIISQHFIFGVGTGDVQQAFNDYYSSHHSVLGQNNRRRAHNQYVTFFVTFGLIGFVVFLLSLFGPVFIEKRWNDYLFIVFFLLGLMSMLNEDTLETQTGVSFFMFFYCLFLFAR